MNHKETCLRKMMTIIVECCATEIEGDTNLKIEDLVGPSRRENIVLTRSIAAIVLSSMGYSKTTVAQVLNRTVPSVRHMIAHGYELERTNKAFKVAIDEAVERCKSEGLSLSLQQKENN